VTGRWLVEKPPFSWGNHGKPQPLIIVIAMESGPVAQWPSGPFSSMIYLQWWFSIAMLINDQRVTCAMVKIPGWFCVRLDDPIYWGFSTSPIVVQHFLQRST
jgi:hypothetical protein